MRAAYADRPDLLRRVGAAVAIFLLVLATALAGVILWEFFRDDAARPVATTTPPDVVVRLPPPPPIAEGLDPPTAEPEPSAVAAVPPAPEPGPSSSELPSPAEPPPPTAPVTPDYLPQTAALGGALRPAPDPAVLEQSPIGPLPRIGDDGREPWRVYARPFDPTDLRPRVAVVVSGLGLSSAATEAAIQGLPGSVTLAFQPYSSNLQRWIGLARAAGHETLLNLPMEPVGFPQNDPGPQALFTSLPADENIERLEWVLSRVTGYVGVVNHMGSRFMTSADSVEPIMQALRDRGLLFLDNGTSDSSVGVRLATSQGVPHAIGDRFVDIDEVSRVAIDEQLAEVGRIAEELGAAVAVAQAYPVTLERLRVWLQGLEERGIAVAPISAVVNLQGDR